MLNQLYCMFREVEFYIPLFKKKTVEWKTLNYRKYNFQRKERDRGIS